MRSISSQLSSPISWTPNTARLAVAISTAIGGTVYASIQIALTEAGPFFFATARCLLSAFVLFVLAIYFKKQLTLSAMKHAVAPGVFFYIAIAFIAKGLENSETSLAAFLSNTDPFFIPIVNLLLFRKRTTRFQMTLIAVGALGLALLLLKNDLSFDPNLLWFVIAAFLFAVSLCFISHHIKQHDTLVYSASYMLISALFGCVLCSAVETLPVTLSPAFYGILIYFVVVMTLLRFPIHIHALKFISPAEVGILFQLEPVSAAILGVFAFGERLSPHQWVGAAIVITSASFVFSSPERAEEKSV